MLLTGNKIKPNPNLAAFNNVNFTLSIIPLRNYIHECQDGIGILGLFFKI